MSKPINYYFIFVAVLKITFGRLLSHQRGVYLESLKCNLHNVSVCSIFSFLSPEHNHKRSGLPVIGTHESTLEPTKGKQELLYV